MSGVRSFAVVSGRGVAALLLAGRRRGGRGGGVALLLTGWRRGGHGGGVAVVVSRRGGWSDGGVVGKTRSGW